MESNSLQSALLSKNPGKLVVDSEKRNDSERNAEGFIGVLDVYIHEARHIHNICIYQNQDVYAKFCLTCDPERTVSTKVVNGGGRNPVFDENVRLDIRNFDSSLKVEIWMLSRVRNYLEDQLLGFTLVPLRDVLIENGKSEREFSLTSSDLYHSPAGFVKLTLTYNGELPEVLEIPESQSAVNADGKDSGFNDAIPREMFDRIEFLDPKMVFENEQMASEHLLIPCPDLDCENTEQSCTNVNTDDITCGNVVSVDSVAFDGEGAANEPYASETSRAAVETLGTPSVSCPINHLSDSHKPSIVEAEKQDDLPESNGKNASEAENVPLINVNVEPETKVVQEEIVEMYKKSMQQFTEALAKMKLPIDMGNVSGDEDGGSDSGNSNSGEKSQALKGSQPRPKVFYGSRAFF